MLDTDKTNGRMGDSVTEKDAAKGGGKKADLKGLRKG